MPRTCKICKTKFEPQYNSVQLVCSPKCGYEYAKLQKEKAWKKEKKELKQKLKTKQDYEKDLEKIFNKFIRLRDKYKPCISCGAMPGKYRISAGHFYPAGSYKNIRYHEDNVHGQCWYNCNKQKHGNIQEYRRGLKERIGEKRLSEIDGLSQLPKHYSIPELKEMIKEYKEKVKALCISK